ncbi:stage III sporulation protein AE [Clostridiales bacterium]|nr:stage III sporulation protein AE [Clostridiales bacterium]
MKRFIYIFAVFIVLLIIPQTAYAEETDDYQDYLNQYDFSFMEELDGDTYDLLDELGLTNFDYNTLVNFTVSDFLKSIKDILKGAVQTPIEACIAIFVFIILSSFFQNLKSTMINDEMSSVFSTVSALVIAVVLAVKMKTTISLACTAISVCADFVFAFVPVFCIIVAASGNTVAAFSTNTMLLSLAQTLNYISKNIFVPLTNCFLAIGICSGLRSELNLSSLLAFLKKYITTAISMAAAFFVSVLSIKTAVASRADAIGLRSIRFAINSVVPVIGSAISEGLLSIQSYSSLIRSSVGVVGIMAVALVFMPAIIEVVLWRFFLSLSSLVSDVFGDKSVSLVIKAFADAMLIMNVILILSMVTTIISIGILIAAKGST